MSCLLVFYYQKFNDGKRKKTPQYSLFSVPLFCSFLTLLYHCFPLCVCAQVQMLYINFSFQRHGSVCSMRDSGVGFLGFSLFRRQTLPKRVKGGFSLLMTDCIFHQVQISSGCSGCSVTLEWKLVLLRIFIRYKNTMKYLLCCIHDFWNDHLTDGWLFGFFHTSGQQYFQQVKTNLLGYFLPVSFLEGKKKKPCQYFFWRI